MALLYIYDIIIKHLTTVNLTKYHIMFHIQSIILTITVYFIYYF